MIPMPGDLVKIDYSKKAVNRRHSGKIGLIVGWQKIYFDIIYEVLCNDDVYSIDADDILMIKDSDINATI